MQKGTTHSDATKQKMRDAIRPPQTEEHKRKRSASKIGIPRDEATKKKISDAHKARWAKKRETPR